MKLFICPIPLFDDKMSVQAYRLCWRNAQTTLDTSTGHSRMAEALHSPGLDLLEKIGIEAFTNGKKLFVEINPLQLMTGKPDNMKIPPEQIVCIIPGDTEVNDAILKRCEELCQKGYTLALGGFPLYGLQSPYFKFVQYLVHDYSALTSSNDYKSVRSQKPEIEHVMINISDLETYNKIKSFSHTLFSGNFYSQPITAGASSIAPVKLNALQLISHVNQPDFELEDIAKIIGRDPALSISLLRFINSNSRGQKISSIQSGVAVLGQVEVRRWATAAISVNLAEDRPGEITRLSLLRARFAEELATAFELGVFAEQLFISGLFSMLDVILQQPMGRAIHEVAVDKKVYEALVEKSGMLYPVLELIYSYERADWDNVSHIIVRNNVNAENVNNAYVNTLKWYNSLISILNNNDDD